jgi:hypothetical protein
MCNIWTTGLIYYGTIKIYYYITRLRILNANITHAKTISRVSGIYEIYIEFIYITD